MAKTNRPDIKVVKTKPTPRLNIDFYDEMRDRTDTVSIPLTKNAKAFLKKWLPKSKDNISTYMLKTLLFFMYGLCSEIDDDCDDMEEMLRDLEPVVSGNKLKAYKERIDSVRNGTIELMESILMTDTGMERTVGMLLFVSENELIPDEEYRTSLTNAVELSFENTVAVSETYLDLSERSENLYDEIEDIWCEFCIDDDSDENTVNITKPIQ